MTLLLQQGREEPRGSALDFSSFFVFHLTMPPGSGKRPSELDGEKDVMK